MCLALYLFTDNPVDEVAFDKSNPACYVRQITEREQAVKRWVADKANIYYVGSSQGCGCGWSPAYESDEESEAADKAKDREILFKILQLGDYLGSHLIACWEGDQGEELERQEPLDISKIRDANFESEECVDYLLEAK